MEKEKLLTNLEFRVLNISCIILDILTIVSSSVLLFKANVRSL